MSEDIALHAEKKNRTVICTVVFADIVNFSEFSVGVQTSAKEDFNRVVGEAAAAVLPCDRMMLDTGDGVALCLFGDPEQGMFLALTLRDGFSAPREGGTPEYQVRIGLNLGPVKIVTDVNGQYNVIGDGINVAQRVMSFAQPGQVLCARSYFEIVSRLSDDFSRLFEYCGVRHDKHVREHDVYEVRPPGSTVVSGFDLPPEMATPVAPLSISEETRAKLAGLLAKYEGPMAKVLVKRACQAATDHDAVIKLIADGMHDPSEAEAFIRQAKAAVEDR